MTTAGPDLRIGPADAHGAGAADLDGGPGAGTPDQPGDAALLRTARLGDADAFRLIVDRHGPSMYRYAHRLVGSADDAADVTQDALVSAWKALDGFEGRSSLRTWLFRLVHRRAVDLTRRRRPVPVDDEVLASMLEPGADLSSQGAVDTELLRALQQALDALPWHQRAVWLLREVEQLSYEEIAVATGMPPGSVRGHLQRGRRAVAERMASWR